MFILLQSPSQLAEYSVHGAWWSRPNEFSALRIRSGTNRSSEGAPESDSGSLSFLISPSTDSASLSTSPCFRLRGLGSGKPEVLNYKLLLTKGLSSAQQRRVAHVR